jgi:ligand-binding sensor domain-containing protein
MGSMTPKEMPMIRCALLVAALLALPAPVAAEPKVKRLQKADLGKLSDVVFALASGPRGGLWIGTDNGLARHSNDRYLTTGEGWLVTAAAGAGPATAYIGVIVFKQAVGMKDKRREARLYRVIERGDALKTIQEGDPLPADLIGALHVDKKGDVWIATRERGVLSLTKGGDELKPLLTPSELGGHPTSFAEGPDGTTYVGTFGGGVVAVRDGKTVAQHTPKNGLLGNGVVRSVAYHPGVGLLAATAQRSTGGSENEVQGTGLCAFADGKWKCMPAGQGPESSDVVLVGAAPDGAVWITYRGGGASVLRSGGWSPVKTPPLPSSALLFARGSTWIGTSGGLLEISGN